MATGSHRGVIAAAIVAAGLLLGGCSSSSSSSPSSPSPVPTPVANTFVATPTTPGVTSAVCQAAAELRTSVDTLTHVKIGKGTVDEIKSDLASVGVKFAALTTELRGEFKSQTSAVKSALDALKTALSSLRATPSTTTVAGVATGLGGVATATSSLLASLAPHCGSASASTSP